MLKIYLYPIIQLDKSRSMNPYIYRLSDSLSAHYKIVNRDYPMRFGVFDILKYAFSLDILFLNWIEDLPNKRGGILQSILFILIFFLLKISGKKVIWVFHNKKSHSKKHKLIKSILFNLLLKKSDLVLTHASEGLKFIPEHTPKVYIPHPVGAEPKLNNKKLKKVYDIIFWGAVTKYKGIDTFLDYLIEKDYMRRFKILIAGKVVGTDLANRLDRYAAEFDNLTLTNEFIEKEVLAELIQKSKIIVFSYHSDSILSSGALMDSLGYDANIVGPDVGAFSDLRKEGLISTFKNLDDLIALLTMYSKDYSRTSADKERISEFIIENSWEAFSGRISEYIEAIAHPGA